MLASGPHCAACAGALHSSGPSAEGGGFPGKECVVLITPKDGGIRSAADLKRESGLKIAVDGPESGAAVTFELMGQLDPGFRNTAVQYMGSMEALLQLRMGAERSQLAAVMLVQRPRTLSPAIEIVLDNPETFRIAPVRKGEVKSVSLPGDRQVYTEETVRTGIGVDYSTSYETICTRALLVVSRSKLSEELRRRLARVMLESGSFIAPGKKK